MQRTSVYSMFRIGRCDDEHFSQSCQQSETRSVGRATAVVANAVATTLVP